MASAGASAGGASAGPATATPAEAVASAAVATPAVAAAGNAVAPSPAPSPSAAAAAGESAGRAGRGQSTGGSDVLLIGFESAPRGTVTSAGTAGSGSGATGGAGSTVASGSATLRATDDAWIDEPAAAEQSIGVRTGCCSAGVGATWVGAWAAFVDSLVFALPIAWLSAHLRSQHSYDTRDTGYVYGVWAAAALLATPVVLRLLPARAEGSAGGPAPVSPAAAARDARAMAALALAGSLLTLGGVLVFAFAPGAVAFYVGRGAQGAGSAATWAVALALVGAFSTDSERGARYGYVLFGGALGTLTGPVVGGALYDLHDLRDDHGLPPVAPTRDFRLPLYVAIAAAGIDLCARLWLLLAYPPAAVIRHQTLEIARRTSVGVPPPAQDVRPAVRAECAEQLAALHGVIDRLCRRVAQASRAGKRQAVAAVLPDVREVEGLLLEARQDLALNASELLEHVALLHAVQRLLAAHDPHYVLPDDARLSASATPATAAASPSHGLSLSFGTRTRASSSSAVALTSIEVAPVDAAAAGGAPSRRLSADGSSTIAPPANTPASALTPHAAPASPGSKPAAGAAVPPTLASALCGSGGVWCALLWCALSGYYTASLQPTLPLYVADRWGASTAVIGLLFVVLAAGFAAGSPLAAALSDRGGRFAAMLLGLAGVGVTYCVLGQAVSLEGVFGTAFCFGLAQSLVLSPCLPLFADAWATAAGALPFPRVFATFNAFHLFGLTAGAIAQPHIASAVGFDDALLLSATAVAAVWVALLLVSCARQNLN